MSVNHQKIANQNPKAYEGLVSKANFPVKSGEKWSVIEAANYFDLPEIIAKFGIWVICKDGINCLYTDYQITKDRFYELDWVDHLQERTWVTDIEDFKNAFLEAKRMLETGEI